MRRGQLGGFTQGLWTCYYSCDGVTAGTANDGVDRWGATFDFTKYVVGSGVVPRSWMVLKSPLMNGLNWYLIMYLSGTTQTDLTMYLSKAAPTGGTTTARPTATDEWDFGTALTSWTIASGGPYLVKPHMCLSATGDFIFFPAVSGTPNSGVATAVAIIAPEGVHGSDLYPLWAYRNYLAVDAQGVFQYGRLIATGGPTCRISSGGLAQVNLTMGQFTGTDFSMPSWLMVTANAGGTWHRRGFLPDIFVNPGGNAQPRNVVLRDAGGNITHFNPGGLLYIPANAAPPIY
jgi:hypothetical protein